MPVLFVSTLLLVAIVAANKKLEAWREVQLLIFYDGSAELPSDG